MSNLINLLGLMVIGAIALLFWQWRQQEERATRYAKDYCQRNQLQLLDVARERGRLRWTAQGFTWQASFRFGFSSDREFRYEGDLVMNNLRLSAIDVPPYRLPDQVDTIH